MPDFFLGLQQVGRIFRIHGCFFPTIGKTSAQIRQVWTEVDKSHNSWTDGSMVDCHYGG